MKLLGARAKKKLPVDLVEDALEEEGHLTSDIVGNVKSDETNPTISLDEGGLFPELVAGEIEPEDDAPLFSAKGAGGEV